MMERVLGPIPQSMIKRAEYVGLSSTCMILKSLRSVLQCHPNRVLDSSDFSEIFFSWHSSRSVEVSETYRSRRKLRFWLF